MPFDAQEFYTLATWLVGNQANEAGLRTAINRVYYAAHLLAREWLRRGKWEPSGRGDDHSGVIRELRRRRTRLLGDMLSMLREFREHADYHLESTETVLNRDCPHCRKARQSSSTDPLVNENHWNEVRELSERLFPQLQRL